MDVQDLVLQWVFLRSFEARPQLTTFFIQFLTELLRKYAGANLLLEVEKNLLMCSIIQLYVTCNKYVGLQFFSDLFDLAVKQTGSVVFLGAIEARLRESRVLDDYHMDNIMDMVQYFIIRLQPAEISKINGLLQVLIAHCHTHTNTQPTMKIIQMLTFLYTRNRPAVDQAFNPGSREDALVIAAIHHLLEKQKTVQMQGPFLQPIKNEVIEEPGRGDGEGSDQNDAHSDDPNQVLDPELMEMKSNLESFLNNFLRSDDAMAFQYLQLVMEWIEEPKMESLMVANANDIIGSLIKYFQKLYTKFESTKIKYYLLLIDILEKLSSREELVKALCEAVTFELFDTLLYILIATNENKSKFTEGSKEYLSLTKMTGTLNGVILKIISHGDPNEVYQVLFDLLIKCRSDYVPEKFDGLVVKCIVKITQRIEEVREDVELERLFEKMHYYMVLMKAHREDKKDDIGVKVIKTVLNAIVEKFDERKVMDAYSVLAPKESEDNSIKKWLLMVIQTKRSKSADRAMSSNAGTGGAGNARVTESRQDQRREEQHAVSANITKRQPEPEHEDHPEDHIHNIIDKLRQKGLSVAMIPKIIKELTTLLRTLEDEVDIEPYIEDLDDKYKTFIRKEIKNMYTNLRNGDFSDAKSRASVSDYHSMKNSQQINDKESLTPTLPQRHTLRPTASAANIPSRPTSNFDSMKTLPPSTTNSSMARAAPKAQPRQAGTAGNHVEELNEQQRKMEEMRRKIGLVPK